MTSCGKAPEVLQGTVLRYDQSEKCLLVRDERVPNREVTFWIENAEIGAEPQTDDVVRIAYHEVDNRRVASRVMNLTRQKEIGIPGK